MTNRIERKGGFTNNGTGTSLSVLLSSRTNEGDLVLVGISTPGYKPTTPSGWTLEAEVVTGTAGNAGCVGVYVYSRIQGPSDGTTQTFSGITNTYWIYSSMTFAGADTSTPIDVTPATDITTPASQTYTLAGVTTATDEAWLAGFIGVDADSTVLRITAALTNGTVVDEALVHSRATTASVGGQEFSMTARQPTAGATGNLTRTETTLASISVSATIPIRGQTTTEMRVAQLGARVVRNVNPGDIRVAQLGARVVRSRSIITPPVQSRPIIMIAM